MTAQVGRTNLSTNSLQPATIETRYAKSTDNSGWLWIRLEPQTDMIKYTIPEYTKVLIQKKEKGRTYFLIQEGLYKNRLASLSDSNVDKCLLSEKRGTGAVIKVTTIGRKWEISNPRNFQKLQQLFATLEFNGNTALITQDSDVTYKETDKNSPLYNQMKHSQPLPNGTYKILAPQTAKDAGMTGFYRNLPYGYPELKYDTVWFPIEYAPNYNSNFIHVGHLSEGCITCYELEKWNALYEYLIKNRADKDGKYIGTLVVN